MDASEVRHAAQERDQEGVILRVHRIVSPGEREGDGSYARSTEPCERRRQRLS
jgi:hypothetical protein